MPPRAIKNVSVPIWFWQDLAARPKASRSFTPEAWEDLTITTPSRRPETLVGLREAVYFYEFGRAAETRERFAGLLLRVPAARAAWLRALAHELRSRPGHGPGFTAVPDDAPAGRRPRKRRARASEPPD